MKASRFALVGILLSIGFFATSPPGHGLSCLGLTPEQYLSNTDSAFVGSVLQVRPRSGFDAVVVKVEGWQKGKSPENPITVLDGFAMKWRKGGRYQIFATIAPLGFETHPCSGTKELAEGEQPVGRSVPPGVFHPLDQKPAASDGIGSAVLIGLGSILMLGVAVWRASRARAGAGWGERPAR